MKLNTVEELVEDIRQGKMVILMDDEDRENEGDLVIAAEQIRPEDINFMAKHARGLICLTLTRERCNFLGLNPMVHNNHAQFHTNFTVSIEAASGVTTGISAADRAHTVRVAVGRNTQPEDIVQPGHIFPLMAEPGGVLSRAGHTEAGCDLARMAGYEPAAVIVEIMNEDGSMARRKDLEKFAVDHELKLGTIEDLIHYRLLNEKTVICSNVRQINTTFGAFELRTYLDTSRDQVHHALVKGDFSDGAPVLTRVHLPTPLRDYFGLIEPGMEGNPIWTLHSALERISEEGRGVIVALSLPVPTSKMVEAQLASIFDEDVSAANTGAPNMQIGVGSQILRDLGVHKMLLMGAPVKYTGISGFDLEVVDYVAPESQV